MTQQTPKPQALSGQARTGTLPFSPQGWPYMIALLATTVIAYALSWTIPTIISALLFLFVVNFFRDFERDIPQADGLVICPADGKVIRAEKTDTGLRVDIFMNVFDVHVNRAPMSGKITAITYIPGKFVNASFDSASVDNERNRFELETTDGLKIQFTQIAGLVARRIISYVKVGDEVQAGQRIGMIRFGSRVDCEIPEGFELNVKVGDKVSSASTILARKITS